MGFAPVNVHLQPVIWVHGVSLGEINAARSLVNEIHSQLPDYRVVVSSTTDTGMTKAMDLFSPDHKVFFWPLDLTFFVKRALDRIKPELVVLMEGEYWPNFLSQCRKRGIRTAVVNGRLSPTKGYPRYRMLGRLARKLIFDKLDAVGAQNDQYAELFEKLGVDLRRISVTGMLKYDTAGDAHSVAGAEELGRVLGVDNQKVFVAGGTGKGEEKIVLDAWNAISARHGDARLVIVPRKPERFEEVARLIRSSGYELVRRSEHPDGAAVVESHVAVILGDTMGELRKFYSLATCIFVGRSLVKAGGSDMIEAGALGRAVCFGPHTFNFPQARDLERNGCLRVADGEELANCIIEWLSDPDSARAAGQQAREYILGQRGATVRNVEMICRLLGREPAAAPGAIATEALEN